MRTGSLTLDGAICVAEDAAFAPCSTLLFWPAACTALPVLAQPQGLPGWLCITDWPTGAVFVAFAEDSASFSCDTEPPLPGLNTRTERFVFSGCTCVAEDAASAPCFVSALCVDDWTPPEPPPVWELPCVVGAELEASADEEASFDCLTLPSFPGLRTRTEMCELLGLTCFAEDVAAPTCVVDASCVDDCTPPPFPDGAACVAACVVGAVLAAVPVELASFA